MSTGGRVLARLPQVPGGQGGAGGWGGGAGRLRGGVLALPSSVDLAVQLPPFLSPAALGKGLPGGGGLPLRSWELLGAKPAWVCHPLAPCPGPLASLLWVLLVWGQRCRRQVSGLCCVTVGKVTAPGHLGNPLGLCALCACCEYVCGVSPWYPSVCVCVYVYVLRICCLCVCSVCCLCVVVCVYLCGVCVCLSVWCVCGVCVCVWCMWDLCVSSCRAQRPRCLVVGMFPPDMCPKPGPASGGLLPASSPTWWLPGLFNWKLIRGRARVGVSLAGTAASPGLGLAGGCWLPCQRPGLWPLLALPPPLWSLTLGPQGLWAWRSNCP